MPSTPDEIRALAALLHAARPTWDLAPTANHLLPHRDMPLDQLTAAAIRCAQNPANRTPATLQWLTFTTGQLGERVFGTQKSNTLGCFICGRSQSRCEQMYDIEQAHGLDTHRFESLAQAEANKASNQWSEEARVAVAESRSRRAQERADHQAHTSTPEDA